jgi:hypothetical protein
MAEEALGWRMLVAMALVCMVLAIVSRLLLMRIDKKWRHETFTV